RRSFTNQERNIEMNSDEMLMAGRQASRTVAKIEEEVNLSSVVGQALTVHDIAGDVLKEAKCLCNDISGVVVGLSTSSEDTPPPPPTDMLQRLHETLTNLDATLDAIRERVTAARRRLS